MRSTAGFDSHGAAAAGAASRTQLSAPTAPASGSLGAAVLRPTGRSKSARGSGLTSGRSSDTDTDTCSDTSGSGSDSDDSDWLDSHNARAAASRRRALTRAAAASLSTSCRGGTVSGLRGRPAGRMVAGANAILSSAADGAAVADHHDAAGTCGLPGWQSKAGFSRAQSADISSQPAVDRLRLERRPLLSLADVAMPQRLYASCAGPRGDLHTTAPPQWLQVGPAAADALTTCWAQRTGMSDGSATQISLQVGPFLQQLQSRNPGSSSTALPTAPSLLESLLSGYLAMNPSDLPSVPFPTANVGPGIHKSVGSFPLHGASSFGSLDLKASTFAPSTGSAPTSSTALGATGASKPYGIAGVAPPSPIATRLHASTTSASSLLPATLAAWPWPIGGVDAAPAVPPATGRGRDGIEGVMGQRDLKAPQAFAADGISSGFTSAHLMPVSAPCTASSVTAGSLDYAWLLPMLQTRHSGATAGNSTTLCALPSTADIQGVSKRGDLDEASSSSAGSSSASSRSGSSCSASGTTISASAGSHSLSSSGISIGFKRPLAAVATSVCGRTAASASVATEKAERVDSTGREPTAFGGVAKRARSSGTDLA